MFQSFLYLWSFHALFTYENEQLDALDIKAGTYEAKFAAKRHTCGICLSAQVEIPVFTRTTGPHPFCQLMGTGGYLPGIKQSAHETHHSHSSSASLWICAFVHSCQQKSIGLKFSKSQTGNDVRYNCHHNSSRFTFPIFAHSCCFSVLHSLQSITPHIY